MANQNVTQLLQQSVTDPTSLFYAVTGGATDTGLPLSVLSSYLIKAYPGFLQVGTGAVTRTVQAKLQDFVSVKDFGAAGNGTTDDTAAIKAACAALNTAGGGTLYFPQGTYLYTSTVFTNVLSGVTLKGANKYGSTITTNNVGANMFYVAGSGAKIENLGFTSTVTNTSGTFLNVNGTANVVDDVYIAGDFNGILLGGVAAKLSKLVFGTGASGSTRIIVNSGDSSNMISDVTMLAQSAPFPLAGIQLQNVTAIKLSEIDILTQGTGLLINPGNGQAVNDVNVVNCFFDSGTIGCSIQPTGTGSVSRVEMVNSWTGDSSNNGILINNLGTGIVSGITFINHQSAVCGQNGALISGTCTGISFIGGDYSQNSVNGINANHTGDVKIIGINAGNYAGFSGNTNYGIILSATLTNVICNSNSLLGNTAGSLLDNSSGSIAKALHSNIITGYSGTFGVPLTTAGNITTTAGNIQGPAAGTTLSTLSGTSSGGTIALNDATHGNAITFYISGVSMAAISPAGFTPSSTSGIVGTTSANNANPGSIGETVTANATAVSLTSATAANITSISLTAGDWDVEGNIYFNPAGTTVVSSIISGLNSTSATVPVTYLRGQTNVSFTGVPQTEWAPKQRFNLSTTTTIYLVGQASFTTSTLTADGYILARRVR